MDILGKNKTARPRKVMTKGGTSNRVRLWNLSRREVNHVMSDQTVKWQIQPSETVVTVKRLRRTFGQATIHLSALVRLSRIMFPGLWLTIADDGTPAKSRKGTVRNTDSFFKDDSVETRKINLTPSLLRDDSKGALATSSEFNDVGLPRVLSGFLTNQLISSSRRDQASTRSRRTILQRKAKKTKNRRKKEVC